MADEIIDAYGDLLQTTTLVRAGKGVFEVTVDGKSIFSKQEAHRHAEPGEIVEKMQAVVGESKV